MTSRKVIVVFIVTAIVLIGGIFFAVPYMTEESTIQSMIRQSKDSAEKIKITRAYYSKNVVKDIKKFAPELSFSYNHSGANGVLPLPTTLIHDLSKLFSENTGVKYSLYSEYPFKNREKRVLTPFQKEAIEYTQKNPDGLYVKRDIYEGKEVLRVATTDFMTDLSCVNCHNNHSSRTWKEGKWKLGDKRGILEVITPIEKELNEHMFMRNYMMLFVFGIFFIVLLYIWLSSKRKN